MKLEVGMYVKFKTLSNQVKLGQIQLIDNSIYELDNNEVTADKYIVKARHNIIDLIEVGDYVNGLRVEKNKYGDLYTSYVYYGGDIGKQCEVYTTWLKELEEDMIYSIVTHEQIEQIAYKLDH